MDFMSAYLAGWSVLSLMCLIIGLGLMIAEMFTPGLGLMGMFGIIALIAAIVLSAHSLLDAIFTLAIIFVVLFIAGFIVYRSFTKGRLANSSIVLSDRIDSASTSLDDAEIQGIVGKEGITTTALRPSGNAEIDGKRYDIVTSGEFIQKDTRITVERIDGRRMQRNKMKVCKKCGTLYNEKEGPCPKCYTEDLLISGEAAKHEIDTDMTPEEAEKARKKSWIQILIGMPLFIGFIYIIFLLIRLMK